MRAAIKYCITFFMLFIMSSLFAQPQEVHKTFETKKTIKIKTVSGDCIVKKGSADEIKVDLKYSVDPEDAFEPDIQETSNSIRIKERWYGSSTGRVTWTLTVPANVEIDFSTASGDLSIYDLSSSVEASTASGDISIENSNGEFEISTASGDINLVDSKGECDFSTASGDIEVRNVEGELEFSTASGDIEVKKSTGVFDLRCASGEIEATDVIIDGDSEFSTASGDVEVRLAESSKYDLDLSAASGDVKLDYNGNTVQGYFEFTAHADRGRIDAPFDFDKEEEFEEGRYTYMKKSFTKEGATPRVILSTSSGKAILVK